MSAFPALASSVYFALARTSENGAGGASIRSQLFLQQRSFANTSLQTWQETWVTLPTIYILHSNIHGTYFRRYSNILTSINHYWGDLPPPQFRRLYPNRLLDYWTTPEICGVCQEGWIESLAHVHRKWCDTIRYDTIRYDTIRYDTIRYDTIRYDTWCEGVIVPALTMKLLESKWNGKLFQLRLFRAKTTIQSDTIRYCWLIIVHWLQGQSVRAQKHRPIPSTWNN